MARIKSGLAEEMTTHSIGDGTLHVHHVGRLISSAEVTSGAGAIEAVVGAEFLHVAYKVLITTNRCSRHDPQTHHCVLASPAYGRR